MDLHAPGPLGAADRPRRLLRARRADPHHEQGKAQPDHEVELAERVAEERAEPVRRDVPEEAQVHVGDARQVVRRAVVAVDVDEEVAGDPEREEVHGRAAHDLVGAQVDREDGVHEVQRGSEAHPDQHSSDPAVRHVGAPGAEERAHQHHPLETDVHDPASLREHPADGGERERRREPERRRHERRPGDDGVEMGRCGARGEGAAEDADDSRGDGAPPRPQVAAAHDPHANGDGHDADDDRDDDRPRRDGREREPEGEEAQEDPEDGRGPRARDPRAAELEDGVGPRDHAWGTSCGSAFVRPRRSFRRSCHR